MSVANVGIKLTLDGAQQAEAGLRRVQGGMAALGSTAESVRGAMQQLAGAFAGVVSVRAFVQAADAVTQLQNQLRLATGSTQAATAAYQQLFEIAQRSRVSFTELGGTFATIARATESLGLSQQQLLRLTEAIGNAITVSGSSAQASQAALVQLGQGLAAGALRGDELNSVLEQTPRLARALADGLGVSVGQLRKLGEEGKLTAEAVIAALQSQASVLANEAQSSVVTVGQAFTQLQNALVATVGDIDSAGGITQALATSLSAVATTVGDLRAAFKGLSTDTRDFTAVGDAVSTVLRTMTLGGTTLYGVLQQVGLALAGVAAAFSAFMTRGDVGAVWKAYTEDAKRAFDHTIELGNAILNSKGAAAEAAKINERAAQTLARQGATVANVLGNTVVEGVGRGKKAIEEFAKSVERGVKLYGDLTAQSRGLSGNFAEQWKDLSAAFQAGKISLEQLVAAQAQLLEQQPFAKELANRIKALERSAASAEEQLQRLLDEEKALTIAAEKNITLAQALEEVAIARLRERQAALMAEGDRDAEVLAIQREIDARKRLVEAIGRKEARDAATESAKEAEREWQRTAENIERSLTDALMRGFESGKDFARNLRDTIVNMFKTLVLRPVIQAVVAPVAGAITGALGLPGTANAATGGPGAFGMASSLKSIYDTVVGGFTALGNMVASAAQDIGAWLVNNTTGVLNRFGGSLMSNAGALGTGASYLGGIGAGIGLGNLISGGYSAIGKSGNTANVIGTGVGAFFGGPIGAAIGGAVGGLANRAFGRKLKDHGIEGTFGGDGFTGNSYQFYKGGWFRSNKTKRSALDPNLDAALDQQFMAIKTTALGLGEVLGVARTALDGFTQSIKLSFKGLNEQQIQEKLNEVFNGLGESMARSILGASAVAGAAFIKEGETAQQALVRLAGSLQAVNGAIDLLGGNLLEASLASGDLASKIVDAFGGLDQFGSAVQAYYTNFYTEQERLAKAVESMGEAFAGLGLTMPKTKAEFRALVEAQDLSTESGRAMYAALMQLQGAFAELTAVSGNAADDVGRVADEQRRIAEERARLERRLLELQGDTAALRQLDLQALDESNRALQQQIWALEDARAAQEAYARALEDARARFSAAESALAAAQSAVDAIRQQATNEYLAAQDRVTAAQERISQILREQALEARRAAEAMRDLGRNLREFVQGELAQPTQLFADTLRRALAGDEQAMRDLPAAARGATDQARLTATTSEQARLAEARIMAQVLRVANMAESTPLPSVPAAVDPLVEAQQELARAQSDLANALRVANTIGASLTPSINDLVTQYSEAVAELARAQSEYAEASRVLRAIESNTGQTSSNTSASLLELGRARLQIVDQLVNGFTRLDTNLDGLLTFSEFRTGFAGLATESTLLSVFRELDVNGDGTISRLEAIRSNTSASLLELGRAKTIGALIDRSVAVQTDSLGVSEIAAIATKDNSRLLSEANSRLGSLADPTDGLWSERLVAGNGLIVGRLDMVVAAINKQTLAVQEEMRRQQDLAAAQRNLEAYAKYAASQRPDALVAMAPTTMLPGQSNDSLWNAIVQRNWDAHVARYGRGWNTRRTTDAQRAAALRAMQQEWANARWMEVAGTINAELERLRKAVRALGGVPAFAMGGMHSGGVRLVGERGPEIEVTGPARYWSFEQTRRMMTGLSSDSDTVTELRALRADNQAQARAIVQLQQRMTKVIERWDGNGLPEERVVA